MRTSALLLLVGCSTDPAPSPALVDVTLSWVSYTTTSSCTDEPACTTDMCGGTDCACTELCPQGVCPANTITRRCCTATARVMEADLPRLWEDYARCTPSGDAELSVDCSEGAPVYLNGSASGGSAYPYTADEGCAWTPPYGIQ